jgi:hypothetical protein
MLTLQDVERLFEAKKPPKKPPMSEVPWSSPPDTFPPRSLEIVLIVMAITESLPDLPYV